MQDKHILVAIHGAGMTGAAFGGIMPHLAEHQFRMLSLPGHTPDDKEAPLATIAEMADWLKGRLEWDHPRKNILIGHSLGALVAIKAADHPSVDGLVLLGAAPRLAVNVGLLQAATENPEEALSAISNWGVFEKHPQLSTLREVIATLLRKAPGGVLATDLRACHNFDEAEKIAPTINKPVLVIAGDSDKMVRSLNEGQILADMFPQGEFCLMENCGHMIMVEKPNETAREIKRFIESVEGR